MLPDPVDEPPVHHRAENEAQVIARLNEADHERRIPRLQDAQRYQRLEESVSRDEQRIAAQQARERAITAARAAGRWRRKRVAARRRCLTAEELGFGERSGPCDG